MHRIKLTIAYNGTPYCGWQLQAFAQHSRYEYKEQKTIQGELEKVLTQVIGQAVRVHGAGRTDSGVHAEGQVAHFDVISKPEDFDWQKVLNCLLPPEIRIVKAELVPLSFHSRFDAVAKSYSYNLWLDDTYTPPFLAPFVWTTGCLNSKAMEEATTYLVGEHDFCSVQNHGSKVSTTVRTLFIVAPQKIETSNYALFSASSPAFHLNHSNSLQIWHFKGNGFLKQMVRNLMGLLWSVGKELITPEQVLTIIEAKDRKQSAKTAPAHALFLNKVYY